MQNKLKDRGNFDEIYNLIQKDDDNSIIQMHRKLKEIGYEKGAEVVSYIQNDLAQPEVALKLSTGIIRFLSMKVEQLENKIESNPESGRKVKP